MEDPAGVFESFRQALREALKGDPTGDFGAEVAVAAFDECIAIATMQGRKAAVEKCLALVKEAL